MSSVSRPLSRRSLRLVLMWLLALVLPLQGTAVGVFTVMGPLHIHQPADDSVVLTDFRRWRPSAKSPNQLLAAVGHFHGAESPQRHRHEFDAPGAERVGDDISLNSPDADEGLSANASLASVLALLPANGVWVAPKSAVVLPWRPSWIPRTGFTVPPDQPPRQG